MSWAPPVNLSTRDAVLVNLGLETLEGELGAALLANGMSGGDRERARQLLRDVRSLRRRLPSPPVSVG